MARERPTGPFVLWQNYGCEGWNFTNHETLTDALNAERFQYDWVIHRAVDFVAIERSDKDEEA